MKVRDLKIDKEVLINGFKYAYKGVNKIRMSGYWVEKIVFKAIDTQEDKHFDFKVFNKDLKVDNEKIELK
ncbi:hypothetical protein [Chryseobacterium sp.]|jgi:hypothetical protein|uniref:hypothetical protein n=1 Tax=Chryseobacterium sp. TaxID=1871047 RepID=UPI002848075E|nr:hypothetical protein [Chryseobacterium sp.]MDR3026021.1 hypothetical protein [Chryseobacterium sp.]